MLLAYHVLFLTINIPTSGECVAMENIIYPIWLNVLIAIDIPMSYLQLSFDEKSYTWSWQYTYICSLSTKKGLQFFSNFIQQYIFLLISILILAFIHWSLKEKHLSKLASLKFVHRNRFLPIFYIDRDKCNETPWNLKQKVNISNVDGVIQSVIRANIHR